MQKVKPGAVMLAIERSPDEFPSGILGIFRPRIAFSTTGGQCHEAYNGNFLHKLDQAVMLPLQVGY